MVKVLHELGNLDGGGVARLLYDYYYYIDRDKVHFDFIVYDYYQEGILEKPLEALGANIYKLPTLQENRKKCLSDMKKILTEGKYNIAHSHRGPQAYYFLSCAKQCGVKKRIAHSHLAQPNQALIRRLKNRILLKADKTIATDLFACGREAGIAMWGKHDMKKNKVHIMTNAVNNEKFRYSETMREIKRKELGLTIEFTIGIVGRLEEQKNYPFLLEIFREVTKREPKAVLVIVGRGSLDEKIRALALEKGVDENVRFLGVRNDVPDILNAFDVFVLPSLYEGLPVVLVEAQANGLPEFVSENVTDEMAVTDLLKYLPLGNACLWADEILKRKNIEYDRSKYMQIVSENGYGIASEAQKLEKYYLKGVN